MSTLGIRCMAGGFLATCLLGMSAANLAHAGEPHDAAYKALGQRSYQRSYRNYTYQYQPVAPVEQRAYSAAPEATSDVPAPPAMTHEDSAPAMPPAPAVQPERRGYSYQPEATYRPEPSYSVRRFHSRGSVPAYVLPRAMRQ